MKLFKKKTVEVSKGQITPLDKNQLNAIIGGTEVGGTEVGGTESIVVKFKGVIMS